MLLCCCCSSCMWRCFEHFFTEMQSDYRSVTAVCPVSSTSMTSIVMLRHLAVRSFRLQPMPSRWEGIATALALGYLLPSASVSYDCASVEERCLRAKRRVTRFSNCAKSGWRSNATTETVTVMHKRCESQYLIWRRQVGSWESNLTYVFCCLHGFEWHQENDWKKLLKLVNRQIY